MSFSIQEALDFGAKTLATIRSRLESEILLAHILQSNRIYLHTHSKCILKSSEFEDFKRLVNEAKEGKPIEYLTQKVSFYDWEFEICEGVLIPRPETEILVDKCDELIKQRGVKHIFELGVGSGIISISLALLNPEIQIIASDINPLALALTQKNIQKFCLLDESLKDRIILFEGDVLQSDEFFLSHSLELWVSNPPYIANDYILPKNVSYEQKESLFGGERGDEILQKILQKSKEHQIPYLACEMGWDQKQFIKESAKDFADLEFYQDLSGLDRGFVAKRAL
ncbi:HemK/PrmC family methyltransferase [uncultured Helicobacter sp.]|uniref:N5-glutamine methyltransferase family protein n=1 Tax=uncultured Helicobacter sp. TaxID=175537 RepID=UPI00260B2382|nr:HemK/PrmC family methyltransferase [uncultured Helicobacter sp.]